MNTGAADVHQTRMFGSERRLGKQILYALGLFVLGILVYAVEPENTRESLALMLVSVVFIGYALYRQSTPNKPIFELSPEGMLYRIPAVKEIFVPWSEVHGVESADIGGTNWLGLRFRKVTVAVVTRSFYDANIFIDSAFKRGLYWSYRFIPKGDMVQIAVHHELLAFPAAEVREAVEARWRAFSGHPNAKLPAATNAGDRGSLRAPSRALILGALAVLAILAVPAIYFWRLPVAWLSFPDIPPGSRSGYLDRLLDGTGVAARLAGGHMVRLSRDDVSEIGTSSCVREIARDASGGASLTPSYAVTAYCTAGLKHRSGTEAVAIFKLVIQTSFYEDWQDKRVSTRSIVTAPLGLEEADAKLCQLGSCAPGAEPASR